MKEESVRYLISRKEMEKVNKRRVIGDAMNNTTAKTQLLLHAENLSMPSFQVVVMNANMRCSSCRDRVYKLLSKMIGFREYMVDVSNKQVIITSDVKIIVEHQRKGSKI